MASVLAQRPAAGLSRHFAYLSMRVPDAFASFAIVAALAATGLAAETVGNKVAVLGYLGVIGLAVLLFPHFAIKANLRNVLLWAFPAWMLFSIAWSSEPEQSLHGVATVFATLVGTCLVGALPHRRAVNTALYVTLALFIAYSAVSGHIWRMSSTEMFTGIIARKNQFGHLAALEIMVTLGMLAWAASRDRGLMLASMGAALLVGFGSLLASHATGSLLAALIASCFFVALLTFRQLALPFRATLIAALAAIVILYLVFGAALEQQVFETVLVKFGKDTTLTGRTELWEIADRLIAKHPWIGAGTGSFWSVNNPDAWTVWRQQHIQPGSGFTFHNTFRDILVDYGWIGLGLFLFGIGWHFVRAFFGALASGGAIDACRVATLVYFLIRTPVETITYGALTMDIIPLIGFLCIPVTPGRRWRPIARDAAPQRAAPPPIDRGRAPMRARVAVRAAEPASSFRTE